MAALHSDLVLEAAHTALFPTGAAAGGTAPTSRCPSPPSNNQFRKACSGRARPSPPDENPLLTVPGYNIDENVPCALFILPLLTARRTQGPGPRVGPADLLPANPASSNEVHDYHDIATGVRVSSLAGHIPGGTSLSSRDPASIPSIETGGGATFQSRIFHCTPLPIREPCTRGCTSLRRPQCATTSTEGGPLCPPLLVA